jgi:hypothetical protein
VSCETRGRGAAPLSPEGAAELVERWTDAAAWDPDDAGWVFDDLFRPLERARRDRDDLRLAVEQSQRRLGEILGRLAGTIRTEAREDTATLVLALAQGDPGADPGEIVAKWLAEAGHGRG